MNKDCDLILEHVTKLYGKGRGIQDLSVRLSAGEIAAFIGPNGRKEAFMRYCPE